MVQTIFRVKISVCGSTDNKSNIDYIMYTSMYWSICNISIQIQNIAITES